MGIQHDVSYLTGIAVVTSLEPIVWVEGGDVGLVVHSEDLGGVSLTPAGLQPSAKWAALEKFFLTQRVGCSK